MTIILGDRIRQITTTSGDGSLTLSGTPSSFRPFSSVLSSGDSTYYCIENGNNFEVGIGTYGLYGPNTLSRDTVFTSSTGSKLDLSGRSFVFITVPADRTVHLATSGIFDLELNLNYLSDVTITVPSSGDILYYNGSQFINIGAGTAAFKNVGISSGNIPLIGSGNKISSNLIPPLTTSNIIDIGSIATQSSSGVNITGGSITNINDLSINDGGTGASTASGARANLGLGNMALQNSGSVNITGGTIIGLPNPSISSEAANKAYVDTFLTGLRDFKESCKVASTANLTLSGLQIVDGYQTIANDRVLVKNNGTASQNGIYLARSTSWVRSTDADASSEVSAGMYTYIERGVVNSGSSWVLSNTGTITLGTTGLSFVKFNQQGGALFSSNNLSDLPIPASGRKNLGLEIGVDVAAFNHDHDSIYYTKTQSDTNYLTKIDASNTYFPISGGTVSGVINCSDSGNNSSLIINPNNGQVTFDQKWAITSRTENGYIVRHGNNDIFLVTPYTTGSPIYTPSGYGAIGLATTQNNIGLYLTATRSGQCEFRNANHGLADVSLNNLFVSSGIWRYGQSQLENPQINFSGDEVKLNKLTIDDGNSSGILNLTSTSGRTGFIQHNGQNVIQFVGFSSNIILYKDLILSAAQSISTAGGTTQFRSATTPQTVEIFNTYTSNSNNECVRIKASGNNYQIGSSVGSSSGINLPIQFGHFDSSGTFTENFSVNTDGYTRFGSLKRLEFASASHYMQGDGNSLFFDSVGHFWFRRGGSWNFFVNQQNATNSLRGAWTRNLCLLTDGTNPIAHFIPGTTEARLRADGGLAIRNLADTADSILTASSGIFSGNISVSGSINKVIITEPSTSATLTIANSGSLITSGANSLTLTTTATSDATIPSGTTILVARDSIDTLSNKRINPRVYSASSTSSLVPDVSLYDMFVLTSLSQDLTLSAPTGIPVNGNKIIIRIKDNGTSRNIAYDSIYRSIGVTLPTTTTMNKTIYYGMLYNSNDTKWDILALSVES